jgi:hypothetical protein
LHKQALTLSYNWITYVEATFEKKTVTEIIAKFLNYLATECQKRGMTTHAVFAKFA